MSRETVVRTKCDRCGKCSIADDESLVIYGWIITADVQVCGDCTDVALTAGFYFAEGIAAALEAEGAARAGNWQRMPCDFCETTDGEMPVHVVETGGKMHAKCAHMLRLYREHAALVDGKFTDGLDAREQERLAAVREELAAFEGER